MDAPEPRIADVDRNRVSGQLRVAFGEGRITEVELEERLTAVYEARTASDLSVIVADLPSPAPPAPPPQARPRVKVSKEPWSIDLDRALPLLSPAVVCTLIYLLSNAGGYFWPAWVWLGCGVAAFSAAVRKRGDDDDPATPEVTT